MCRLLAGEGCALLTLPVTSFSAVDGAVTEFATTSGITEPCGRIAPLSGAICSKRDRNDKQAH